MLHSWDTKILNDKILTWIYLCEKAAVTETIWKLKLPYFDMKTSS